MKSAYSVLWILFAISFLPLGVARAGENPCVTTALKILADYQAGAPKNHRMLHIAYFCPADRSPAPGYQERLGRVMDDISDFYSVQLRQYGLPCAGIPLDKDAGGKLVIHLVKGSRPAAEYSEAKSSQEIWSDVEKVMSAAGIGLSTNHVVVFTRLGYYDGTNSWHNSPYCGSGNCRNGFCWQFDSDILDTRLLQDTNRWVNDRQYGRITLAKYNTIFIGGTAHELGHLFGLPHDATIPADLKLSRHNLMGEGNRHYREERIGHGQGTIIYLQDALELVSNPIFSRVDRGIMERWTHSLTNCQFDTTLPWRVKINGRYVSDQPVYGVVAYAIPDAKTDHSEVAFTGTMGPDNTFAVDLNVLPRSWKTGDIRIILLCASGQHLNAYVHAPASSRWRYSVEADGRVMVGGPKGL